MAPIRIVGVLVVIVDLRGNCLFRPQSPRHNDDWGAEIAAQTGNGRVAVSEWFVPEGVKPGRGRGRGGGREKSREVRRRFAVGEKRLDDILRQEASRDQGICCS
jgi:hypothetical protein